MSFDANCQSLIGLWGVGSKGQCLLDSYGFPIGKSGFKYAFMEVTKYTYYFSENTLNTISFKEE